MPFLGTTGGGSVKQYGGQANLGYFIKNSLRTRGAYPTAPSYLSRTAGTPTNNLKWTYSVWIKRGVLSVGQHLLNGGTGTSASEDYFTFLGSDKLAFYQGNATSTVMATSAVFRDPAAWYHIVLVYDSAQATAANRLFIYVNGVSQSFSSATYPTLNLSTNINASGALQRISSRTYAVDEGFDGYTAEANFIDGQALTPSSFGKTDAATGQWIPKKFGSTYGNNGFYLKFADTSAATAAAIGKDSSPNGNNWTPTNISVTAGVTYDAMIDSPSLSGAASNYAVMNPLDKTSVSTVSNGNLKVVSTAGGFGLTRATMAIPSTGKFYFEVTLDTGTTDDSTWVGVIDSAETRVFSSGFTTTVARSYVETGGKNSGSATTSYGTSYTSGDVIGIAVDMTNGAIYFAKNNTWQNSGDPTSGATKTGAAFTDMSTAATGSWIPFCHDDSSQTPEWTWNFGQRPFAYTPPSGFKSLNTFNLP
jgi:hypothetical protein